MAASSSWATWAPARARGASAWPPAWGCRLSTPMLPSLSPLGRDVSGLFQDLGEEGVRKGRAGDGVAPACAVGGPAKGDRHGGRNAVLRRQHGVHAGAGHGGVLSSWTSAALIRRLATKRKNRPMLDGISRLGHLPGFVEATPRRARTALLFPSAHHGRRRRAGRVAARHRSAA